MVRNDEGGGVIADITEARLARKAPLLRQVWAQWSALRDGALVPRRDALDLSALGALEPHCMILDRVRPGTIRVRQAGAAMDALMGMDARGLPMRAFFELDARVGAGDLLERTFLGPASLEMDLLSHGRDGTGPLAARLLILPLLDHAGRPTKALSCLATDRVVTDAPRRFAVQDHLLAPVRAPRAAPRRRVGDALPIDMAEVATSQAAAAVPWLRVVT